MASLKVLGILRGDRTERVFTVDREQRAMLVVPYIPPHPPRLHLAGAAIFAMIGAVAVLGLFMADYSEATTGGLVATATAGFGAAVALLVAGITARRRFRVEMEPAVLPIPVEPVEQLASVEAV